MKLTKLKQGFALGERFMMKNRN